MGVPKFYRWTSERYPCLSEVINESQIPEFDNLYLDMNGIIHNCSHPNDDDVTFRITEDEIFVNIFAYIENLYNLIRPQKVFFMAVDGVAPRAKMNQQRARRFMSARTAHTQLAKALENGEIMPSEARFDSNCITPGTYFMTRLHQKLDDWIKTKSATDSRWQGRKIILSGHNVPGEGEHKIMDFIRTERAGSSYDPNTRHCMYGLDADLIMLGIVSHEPHFSLLREEVTFNTRPRKNDNKATKKPKRTDSDVKKFHLLHLSLLREYLAWEFADVKDSLPFEYEMERIVDDWILLGLLVGNDFLPHLPNIHIHDDALPLLYSTYKKVLPTLDGYINEAGYLNLSRFEAFLAELALNDKTSFMERLEDEQFMESKRIRVVDPEQQELAEPELVAFESSDVEDEAGAEESKDEAGGAGAEDDEDDAAFVSDHEEDGDDLEPGSGSDELLLSNLDAQLLEDEFNDELATLALSGMNDADFANDVEACWTKTINNQFKRHKKTYYSDKLRYKNISKQQLREQAEGYVRAIQWNLHYYYHGCVSWSWFYPHHYAPFISDVRGFVGMRMEFELSEPFHPFEQLLAVLPEASADCLPRPLRELMSSDPAKSPICDFYPANFETDLNGKRNEWEAVVLIPFIEEKRLLEAIEAKRSRLTSEENARNSHGSHIQCISSPEPPNSQGQWRTVRSEIPQDSFRIPRSQVKWGLLPNVKMDVYFPGFPTMKHLSHLGELRFANCNIFGMASRKESMVLKVENERAHTDIIELGSELCDEEVCIDWPILKVAKIDSIWGGDDKIVRKCDDEIIVKDMSEEEKRQWQAHANQLTEHLMTRFAIEIAAQKDSKGKHIRPAVAWVRKFTGLVYEAQGGGKEPSVLKACKQWSSPQQLMPVLLPLVVKDVLLENSRVLADLPMKQAYPKQSIVWITDPKFALFGMPGMVNGFSNEKSADCRIEVIGMSTQNKVDKMEALRKKMEQKSLRWMGGYDCARQCQVDTRLFARITGTMFLWNEPRERVEKGQQISSSDSKINCGLALKYSRRDLCVADYTDRTEHTNQRGVTNKVWFYTNLATRLVSEYRRKFPDVWKYLETIGLTQQDDVYYTEDIWSNEKTREKRFGELSEFLGGLPSLEAEQLKCGTVYADRQLITEIEMILAEPDEKKPVMNKYMMAPGALFRYELYNGKVHADPAADFQILDRVALMSSDTKVPKTTQGTVVGIHDDKIDVFFDKPFDGGQKVRGSNEAAAIRVPQSALLNVTFGIVRKNVQHKKQVEKALTGAYVPMPAQKNSAKNEPAPSTSSSNSNSTNNKKNSSKKEKNKQKPTKTDEESPEALTDSLNKLLKIKPPSAEATSGKQVSLMELLGGGGAAGAKKPAQNAKTLAEIESDSSQSASKSSILQQLSAAQKAAAPKPKKEASQKKQKPQAAPPQKVEILRKPTPPPPPPAEEQKPAPAPFGAPTPPPQFPFGPQPLQFAPHPMMMMGYPMGMPMGMPIGGPHHYQQQQNQQEKRANHPTLTDFKPSAVHRRQNCHQRPSNQPPKVTMITKRTSSPTPPEKEEDAAPRALPSSPPPPSKSAAEEKTTTKKPRKKKQSRLGSNFSNPTASS
ncbi:5'-3' exoribonuclease 1 [Caenorhabditis elegans]|uniref:5'-3' exoribonuclease 1 n=1 Tax=Caenorhabditis elegans TaxID=6239 RepID=Q9BHK7_CAEEL|nr:5'-3' exoribonuclease 1 [Caenorhabditis elegans]CAC35856.3 5'-3' exoribonuclease 1 [Caenorhabditis elegans]|eukprot:NP_496945.3 5'-3' exoribonuclease 1 [Caenorhabditis elegans]